MAVMLKQQRDGVFRPCWYADYKDENGKRTVVSTGVKWQGTPPASGSMRDRGDTAFEASREKAKSELKGYRDEARRKGNAAHLVERLIEAKTGQRVEHVKLAEIADRWLNEDDRDEPLSEGYKGMCKAFLARFLSFMKERNPKARFLYEVTPADAAAFAASVRASMSPKTYREHLRLLRPAFDRLLPKGSANPFRVAFPRRVRKGKNGSGDSVHRRPFTPDELRAILEAARDDEFMFPLIVTATCTGMRRGDVCGLRWQSVDLAAGMLVAKALKTGEPVEIPIFEPLREVLEARCGNDTEFVFPDAAVMLAENQGGLTWRFKKIVAAALDTEQPAIEGPKPVDPAEIESEALDAIRENVRPGTRRDRMLEVMRRYAAGQSYRQIEKGTGFPRPMLCGDFQAIQDMTGKTFIRGAHKPTDCKRAIARVTRVDRAQGQRAASVRDWHALRTTWVTLALTAGVPMELVRRVTGHATVDVVLKHYFRPGREDFRAALVGALPDVLTGAKPAGKALPPADELATIVTKVQSGSATAADKARLRELAATV